jgi:hypothetical protein
MRLALAAALSAAVPGVASAGPWTEIAIADIDEIQRLLRENHPGPVDPQNPLYAKLMDANYPKAVARAAAAKTFFDYKRAVLSYTNGFRDGHTAVLFSVDSTAYQWPGFAVAYDGGRYRVSEVEDVVPVEAGDEVLSCDDLSMDQLMRDRIDPYFWNADIPHERYSHVGKLFAVDATDEASKLKSCEIRSAAGRRHLPLNWRPLPPEQAERLRGKHFYEGEPKLVKVGAAWLVKLPSFTVETPVQTAQFESLLGQLRQHADEIREGKVVLDVRGNAGGSSTWASRVASAIWGEAIVSHVEKSFDWTVDWRASRANVNRLDQTAARYERNNMATQAEGFRKLRDVVADARRRGQPLVRAPFPPESVGAPMPASPFKGRAYLLTDGVCASACLDFADVVWRLPNATQIGWPTSADAVYIDNTLVPLPSGLGLFAYSMKVYRNRVRGNNEWYDPEIPWPGGPVTDEAVARWINDLE